MRLDGVLAKLDVYNALNSSVVTLESLESWFDSRTATADPPGTVTSNLQPDQILAGLGLTLANAHRLHERGAAALCAIATLSRAGVAHPTFQQSAIR